MMTTTPQPTSWAARLIQPARDEPVCQACLIGLNGEPVTLRGRRFCGHRLCPDCLAEPICARCHTAATRPGSWEAAEERAHATRCGCDYCRLRRPTAGLPSPPERR